MNTKEVKELINKMISSKKVIKQLKEIIEQPYKSMENIEEAIDVVYFKNLIKLIEKKNISNNTILMLLAHSITSSVIEIAEDDDFYINKEIKNLTEEEMLAMSKSGIGFPVK